MSEKVNQSLREALSALADAEATEFEAKRVLKSGADDPEVDSLWSRYQLCGQVMRRDLDVVCDAGFAQRVSEAIEAESTGSSDAAPQYKGGLKSNVWFSHTAKVAVAAGVAFAFLLGVQNVGYNGQSPQANTIANGVSSPQTSVPEGFELPPLNARTVSTSSSMFPASSPVMQSPSFSSVRERQAANKEFEERLNSLMLEHTQSASANGGMSVLPYSRVIELEAAQD